MLKYFFLIFLTIWKFFTVIFSPSVLLLPVHQTNSEIQVLWIILLRACWQFIIGHENKGDPEKKFQMTISQILAPSNEKKSLMKYESEKVWKLNVNEFPICGNILCIEEQIIFYKSQFLSSLIRVWWWSHGNSQSRGSFSTFKVTREIVQLFCHLRVIIATSPKQTS